MNISTLFRNARAAIVPVQASKPGANQQALPFIAMLLVACIAAVPEVALAAPWDGAADKVLEIFTGGLTRTLAMIAVIACGIAAIAGKLSWDWAIKIIVGIVLIFGSATIVDYVISAAS